MQEFGWAWLKVYQAWETNTKTDKAIPISLPNTVGELQTKWNLKTLLYQIV